jgi:hypothetical protein
LYPQENLVGIKTLQLQKLINSHISFNLSVSALGQDGYQYENLLAFEVEVSLFQQGFPVDTNSEYKSSPLVADLDDDGVNELVTADKFGMIRIYRGNEEIVNDNFPFQVQDGVWGAISSADVDLDGMLDFVVSSMSVENTDTGHIYIKYINMTSICIFYAHRRNYKIQHSI